MSLPVINFLTFLNCNNQYFDRHLDRCMRGRHYITLQDNYKWKEGGCGCGFLGYLKRFWAKNQNMNKFFSNFTFVHKFEAENKKHLGPRPGPLPYFWVEKLYRVEAFDSHLMSQQQVWGSSDCAPSFRLQFSFRISPLFPWGRGQAKNDVILLIETETDFCLLSNWTSTFNRLFKEWIEN